MIHYRVTLADLPGHQFEITLRLPRPAADQVLALPVWIPGSYMVRDFARHLSGLQASQAGQPCEVTPLDKSRWQVACRAGAALTLRYRVYAFDPSVRGAFLDDQRGFFNGSSLFLQVLGQSDGPHRLQLGRLPKGWMLATTMPLLATAAARSRASSIFEAADYAELIDHPVALGPFWRGQFNAAGLPHELVVSGAWPRFDSARLLADSRRICQAVQDFWRPPVAVKASAPAAVVTAAAAAVGRGVPTGPVQDPPFDQYLLLLNAADQGYGGLEHRASTALLVPRRDLPVAGVPPKPGAAGDGYTGLLTLICHEYFHAWNVKRLKPADLASPDYSRENHTQLMWFFEGFTTYYEDLLLRRAGLVDNASYLRLLARNINQVMRSPGRALQSVAEASFDAWTKYYRQDENTVNATVSYYAKGALVALALDLSLRKRGQSLDAVMRALWQSSGGGPITEADIFAAVRRLAGRALAQPLLAQLQQWVHGRDDLPLAALLQDFGVVWRQDAPDLAATLGVKLSEGPVTGVQVLQVLAGGAAAAAGLAAGDEILAVDGWRIRRLEDARGWTVCDQACELLLVRDQRVLKRRVTPPAMPLGPVLLSLAEPPAQAAQAVQKRRLGWLGA